MATTDEDAANIEKLKELLAEVLDLEEDFSVDAHFMKDLNLSSLMGLEVMVAVEKEYQVKFEEEEIKKLTTVMNVYEALKEKNAVFN
jgi:acyl carrier protein